MNNNQNSKKYDLEERTLKFAKDVRDFIKKIPATLSNIEYSKQVIRSSSSVGANYIEANESISKKDLSHRIKISRKEAKESKFWLELLDVKDYALLADQNNLANEATELCKIFSSIMRKLI